MTRDVEPVLPGGDRFAEGPTWDDANNRLIWVDIPRGKVHRTDPATGQDGSFVVGQPVGAAALKVTGGYVLSVADGFAVCGVNGEAFEMLAHVPETSASSRMNDGACDAAGRFWAGSMDRDRPGSAALYRLDAPRAATQVLDGVTVSNGIGWSPDNRLMYYADTPTGRVDVFHFDLADGVISDRRPFAGITRGRPDGLTVDAEGFVWVALWLGSAVQRFAPDGRLAQTIELPVRRVTSCAFGGPDLATLFVTTARVGDEELSDDAAHAGAIFAIGTDTAGLPQRSWAG